MSAPDRSRAPGTGYSTGRAPRGYPVLYRTGHPRTGGESSPPGTVMAAVAMPGDPDAAPTDRILILGAGYAGLRCAHALGTYLGAGDAPEVLLVDRHPYHQLITELPAVAGGRSGTDDVALPLERLLGHARVRLAQAEVERIDLQGRQVVTARGTIGYGTLVVAVGSTTAFYGIRGLAEHALTLKSVDDAAAIASRVDAAVRQAAQEPDGAARASLLSVLVGGGGLTGVELAGELAELLPRLAARYGLPAAAARVTLVEAAPVLLPGLPGRLQRRAASILAGLGVGLVLGSRVVSADEGGLTLAAGGRLAGRTLVWAGGIVAPPLLAMSGLPTARNGQVPVDDYLQPAGYPDIYVIGDAARVRDDSARGFLNPTAQAAIGQGKAAAYNIVARREGWPPRPYTPTDRGSGDLARIGQRRGRPVRAAGRPESCGAQGAGR